MTETTLGPKPSDPSQISFAPDCFVQDGWETYYTVIRSALHSAPAYFRTLPEAQAFSRKVNRPVHECKRPTMRRIRWQ